jgi:hypothetical protein
MEQIQRLNGREVIQVGFFQPIYDLLRQRREHRKLNGRAFVFDAMAGREMCSSLLLSIFVFVQDFFRAADDLGMK